MMTPAPPKVIPTTTPMTTTTTEKTTTTEPTTTELTTTEEITVEQTTHLPTTTTTAATTTTTPMTTTMKPTTTTQATTTTKKTTTTQPPTTTSTTTTTTTMATTTTTKRTTTPKSTTTTKPPTTTPDPSDTRYGATSSFHLSDLLQAGVPVYNDGPVSSSEDGPDGFGTSADFGENDGEPERSCLKVNDLSKAGAASEAHMKCWRNPINCKNGFSAAIWAKLRFNRKEKNVKRYLFSTGGDASGTPGVAVYYKGIYLHALVSNGESLWTIHAAGLVANETWSSVAFAWGPKEGLELYINGKREAYVKYPDPLPPPPKAPLKPLQLTLGCRRIKKELYEDFVRGKLDEFVTWQYKIDQSNSDYFLGGMDPKKMCKPLTHPLGCATDMNTLLKKIDETDMTDIDTAMTTIMHVTEVVTSLPPTESSTKGSAGDGSVRNGDKSTDDEDSMAKKEVDKQRMDNLKTMIAIVKKLVNKTSEPSNPGVNPDDLSVLYKMQSIVSVIMSEANMDLWKQLKAEGEDGLELMNSVEDWSTKKLMESTTEEQNVDVTIISENTASRSEKGNVDEIKEKHKPYIYFPDYEKDPKWKELKRNWSSPSDQIRIPTDIFEGLVDDVSIHSVYYNNLHKVSGAQNILTGYNSSWVILDSRIISFEVRPSYNIDVLKNKPVVIFLEHHLEKTKHQRTLSSEDPKIDNWECMRWSQSLEFPEHTSPGGWTTEGCAKINSTLQYTTCSCDSLGKFALLALLEKPKAYVEPEDETWVFAMRGLGYSISIIVLICYICAIATRPSLHDQFHIIRLNLSIAAVGTMLSLFSVDFKRHDWEACRVLSGFIHYFYLVVSCWLAVLTHALFKAFIRGVVEGRVCFYLLFGWGLPLVYVGVVVASSPNYGYDDRCMVGPTRGMRCSLACPLAVISVGCLVWSIVICCNLSSPQIKRIEIVEELNASTKMLFWFSLFFCIIWLVGFVALLELDTVNARSWRKLYQIFNSWLGCVIVFILGLGSKHFRYAVFDKYVKYFHFFTNNQVEPSRFEYSNGYRFDFKHYYLN